MPPPCVAESSSGFASEAEPFTLICAFLRIPKHTNRVRKCANLFEVNGALTPQKRRNVPIVEDFGPICKEFSA